MQPASDWCKHPDNEFFVEAPLAKAQVNRSSGQTACEIPSLSKGFDTEAIQIRAAIWQACPLIVDEGEDSEQQRIGCQASYARMTGGSNGQIVGALHGTMAYVWREF